MGTPSKLNELYDSPESSIDFDYDAIDRALSCNTASAEKCHEEIESIFIRSSTMTEKARSLSKCAALRYAVQELLHIRLKEPIAFDYICIKTLYPELTYDDIIKAMRGCTLENGLQIEPRLIGRHRARIVQIDSIARITLESNDINYFSFLKRLCDNFKQRTKQIMSKAKKESQPAHIQMEFNFNV